ncbi:hypothetical protein ACU635_14460 [[Actinomadura] parvosata]|uniref:hypothetical protein n=1 Tax=[Actinomadura] parvosata TaxID=1955412 RepID=UPI00406C4346
MTAWLVSEDALSMFRMDNIGSVRLEIVDGRGDDGVHPTKRLARAERVRIMIGTRAGEVMCALTCPGRDALSAREELMSKLDSVEQRLGVTVYFHPPAGAWPRKKPGDIWSISRTMPEPDFVHR